MCPPIAGWCDFAALNTVLDPKSGFLGPGDTIVISTDITILHESVQFSRESDLSGALPSATGDVYSGKFVWRVHNFSAFQPLLKTQKIMSPGFPAGAAGRSSRVGGHVRRAGMEEGGGAGCRQCSEEDVLPPGWLAGCAGSWMWWVEGAGQRARAAPADTGLEGRLWSASGRQPIDRWCSSAGVRKSAYPAATLADRTASSTTAASPGQPAQCGLPLILWCPSRRRLLAAALCVPVNSERRRLPVCVPGEQGH